MTSLPISLVCASACWARVSTAVSTADFASTLFGLNSLLRRAAKSSPRYWTPVSAEDSVFASAMVCSPRAECLLSGVVGLLGGGQAAEQGRIGEYLGHQLLGAGLAVPVGDQVRELLACLEQLVERVDLGRDRRRREVVHALEGDVDRDVAFAGERVGHLEGD